MDLINDIYSSEVGQCPVFFGGVSRSGTTILGQALGAHPSVCFRNEMAWFNYFNAFLNEMDFSHSVEHALMAIDHHELLKRISKLFFASCIERYINDGIFDDERIKVWGGKMPFRGSNFQNTMMLFPKAKFIFTVRNGIDVVNSHKNWGRVEVSLESACMSWRDGVSKLLELKNYKNVLIVRYEDMILNPTTFWEDALHFMGLPMDPVVIEKTKTVTNTSFKDLDGAFQEELKSRPNGWKSWSQSEQNTFKWHCQELMEIWNYQIPEN